MNSALLLSGSLGHGHDVMAEACAVSLRQRGWSTRTLDAMTVMGNSQGRLAERVFRSVLSIPGAYDAFHFNQLRPGGRIARLAEGASNRYLLPALRQELAEHPADLIISVFATGAAAASHIKQERPGLATAVFCTDICPHWLWVQDNTDIYLVTSNVSAAFVRRFTPEAQIAVVPAPVRPQFHQAPSQADARRTVGIPGDAACVLLMAGAWGIGPIEEIAEAIAGSGVYVLAVAGLNAALFEALQRLARRSRYVLPFGYSHDVPTLMSAADIVITTSGDTCSEARVVGRHLLLLDLVPGHGRENLQEELARGNADVASPDPGLMTRAVQSALSRLAPDTQGTRRAEVWESTIDDVLTRLGLDNPSRPDHSP